jgi:hypothetical protein
MNRIFPLIVFLILVIGGGLALAISFLCRANGMRRWQSLTSTCRTAVCVGLDAALRPDRQRRLPCL